MALLKNFISHIAGRGIHPFRTFVSALKLFDLKFSKVFTPRKNRPSRFYTGSPSIIGRPRISAPLRAGCEFVAILLCLNLFCPSQTYATEYQDDEVKAAFIYRLSYFIEWPVKDEQSKYVNICILGENPFKNIQSDFEKKSVGNKPIRLIEVNTKSILTSQCKIIFISDSEKSDYKEILTIIKSLPILSVSDIIKFAKNDGMIGLTNFNNSIKLEINLKKLSESQFKIDPNLLEAAIHVY